MLPRPCCLPEGRQVFVFIMAILEMFKKEEEKKAPKKEAPIKHTVKTDKGIKKNEKNVKKSKDSFIRLVTEKTTDLAERGAYSFKVSSNSNKIIVKNEIKRLYGISPVKINILNSPYKKTSYRGRKSRKPGFKKAIVYLKSGDKLPE